MVLLEGNSLWLFLEEEGVFFFGRATAAAAAALASMADSSSGVMQVWSLTKSFFTIP